MSHKSDGTFKKINGLCGGFANPPACCANPPATGANATAATRLFGTAKELRAKQPGQIAALFVSSRTIYRHLPGVEVYDRRRNAKTFRGGMPVVAHPPCRCWSKLRHQVNLSEQEKSAEMDLGKWAVETVLENGGVLEQPAGSLLWDACKLPRCGDVSDPFLFTVYMEQSWFGFPTPKPTWVLVCGVPNQTINVPAFSLMQKSRVSFDKLTKFQRSRTLQPFAEWLCATARKTWWNLK